LCVQVVEWDSQWCESIIEIVCAVQCMVWCRVHVIAVCGAMACLIGLLAAESTIQDWVLPASVSRVK
jgi:hypothetical protein